MSISQRMFAPSSQADRARNIRRSFPVAAYVGTNGSGKTLHAVWDTLPTLEAGRAVLSTVRLLDYENPRACDGWEYGETTVYGREPQPCPVVNPVTGVHLQDHLQSHDLYIRFTNWHQFLEFENGDIIMDEITGVADSADHAGLPHEVRNKFPQLRRADVAIRITGLSWARLNKRLREACLAVTRCRGAFPVPASEEFGAERIFRPKRMSIAGTYSCDDLPRDEITQAAFQGVRPIRSSRLWIPDCDARLAYDTFSPVDVVGHEDLSGPCLICGGARPRHKCAGH